MILSRNPLAGVARLATRMGLFALALMAAAAGAEPAAGGKIFLWEVRSGAHSVYVFGSLHVARSDFYPLPKPVEDAYRQADEVVVEVDISDQAKLAKSLPMLTYTAPDSLDQHVSPAVWKQLEAASTASQQDVSTIKPLKPAALASVLMLGVLATHGYDPQAGIDLHFIHEAHTDHKKIVELESIDFQAGILGGLSDEEGDAMLGETLQESRSGELVRAVDQLAAAWKAGDAETVGRLLRESNKDAASKRVFAKLFDERNAPMADRIATIAAGSEHALIVIGAGHLAGQGNVLELLKAKGLQVRQLP
jgi:uncharacterized protein YbaP (TraB family)